MNNSLKMIYCLMKSYDILLCSADAIMIRVSVLLIFLFCSAIHVCVGQSKEATQEDLAKYYPKNLITSVELLAGPAISFGRGDPKLYNENSNMKLGYSFGLGLRHKINCKVTIGLNLLYEGKGDKIVIYGLYYDSIPPKPTKTVNDIRLNYITSSIILLYNFNQRFGFDFGPYLGYLQSWNFYQEAYTSGSLVGRYKTNKDPYLTYEKFDFGLRAALNYRLSRKATCPLGIQLAGNLGFANIYHPPTSKVINASICILFRYTITK